MDKTLAFLFQIREPHKKKNNTKQKHNKIKKQGKEKRKFLNRLKFRIIGKTALFWANKKTEKPYIFITSMKTKCETIVKTVFMCKYFDIKESLTAMGRWLQVYLISERRINFKENRLLEPVMINFI